MENFLFTSESVSEGHPDKVADQISDAVLDAYLAGDATSRVACETMISTGFVMLAGEITSSTQVDIPSVVRNTIREIGYNSSEMGFDCDSCAVQVALDKQSPDIAMGVDTSENKEQGAGDQGIMFGYAVNETPEFMPLTLSLSHKLVRELAHIRKSGKVSWLRPDSKSQVTVEYVGGKPSRIDAIVLSTQHHPDVNQGQIKELVMDELIPKVVPRDYMDSRTKIYVNPTGRFVIGGPVGDCGLTGRKIIVDTYGGHGAHGGGAFSGKDSSKVDRSAAYAARHIAKNIVGAGL
ncbi:MAG: methionine adenosyltransferase, partial [Flavobacteriales bacterium]|nr:methionine adenosyltransferase [Flavobacteriales bacterium]